MLRCEVPASKACLNAISDVVKTIHYSLIFSLLTFHFSSSYHHIRASLDLGLVATTVDVAADIYTDDGNIRCRC